MLILFRGLRLPRPLRVTLTILPFIAAGAAAQAPAKQYSPADVTAGARVYTALCVGCHGPTGAAIGGIDLRQGPLPRASTDAALASLLASGIPGTGMPAFRLDPADLRSVVAFIRSGFDANVASSPAGDPARGQMIFEGKGGCLSCHRTGTRGRDIGPDMTDIGRTRTTAAIQRSLIDPTGSMLPINRPVRAVKQDGTVVAGRRLNEDTYTVQIVTEEGRLVSLIKSELRQWSVSTTSPMPSYKDTLKPDELIDLVTYLVTLKGSRP